MLSNISKIFVRNLASAKKAAAAVKPQTQKPVKPQIKITDTILEKLSSAYGYKLIHTEVNNQSWKHDEPRDSEKYLEIIVVCEAFEGIPKVKRLEYVKEIIKDEMKFIDEKNITFNLLTPSKWFDSNKRGLKLKDQYCDPPVFKEEQLEQISKSFYLNVEKIIAEDAKKIVAAQARIKAAQQAALEEKIRREAEMQAEAEALEKAHTEAKVRKEAEDKADAEALEKAQAEVKLRAKEHAEALSRANAQIAEEAQAEAKEDTKTDVKEVAQAEVKEEAHAETEDKADTKAEVKLRVKEHAEALNAANTIIAEDVQTPEVKEETQAEVKELEGKADAKKLAKAMAEVKLRAEEHAETLNRVNANTSEDAQVAEVKEEVKDDSKSQASTDPNSNNEHKQPPKTTDSQ